jgi:hypothetical protein
MTGPASATIYYTTNLSDPRLPDGTVSPSAVEYSGPITLTTNVTLRARAFATNTWSAIVEADYLQYNESPLVITHYALRSDGSVELDLSAPPLLAYQLQVATNLLSGWQTLANIAPTLDGHSSFIDQTATNHPIRFYRLAWP